MPFFGLLRKKKEITNGFLWGIFVYATTFLLVGSPNILYGKANYSDLLYSNLVSAPLGTSNYILPYPWWLYLPIKQYPILFGNPLYILSIIGFIFLIIYLLHKKNWKKLANKYYIFLLTGFILFIVSLIPLAIGAAANRLLVLLPFLSLISSIFITILYRLYRGFLKNCLIVVLLILLIVQFVESATWMYIKIKSNPQIVASNWIEKNIKKGSIIDIENIPIYQFLPDIVLKEFYEQQYNLKLVYRYKYNVVDSKTKSLDSIVIITNDTVNQKLFKESAKNDLVKRLSHEGYKKVIVFYSDQLYKSLFVTDVDLYQAGIISTPLTISVYKK